MELWIRSQDKNVLVICSKLYVGGTYGNEIIEEDMCSLGEYRSSERALEVLDEIQEAKLGNFHYRCPSNVKVSSKEDTIIYEMPEN